MTDALHTSIVIFGGSGDLSQRKLIPSLFNLYRKGRLPEPFCILGYGKTQFSDDQYRNHLADGLKQFAQYKYLDSEWEAFAPHVYFQVGGYAELKDYEALDARLSKVENGAGNRLFYMALPPGFFTDVVEMLGKSRQLKEDKCWRRVVIEKPFGTDLASAGTLNEKIHEQLAESQIYRIDHYLGKETVQNILVTRFANTIFEPLWNRNYIDHVEITVAETVGVEHRGGYYDGVGVLRDMFQNHLMQLVCLVAMEPPASFTAEALRNEKVKVLSSIQPFERREVPLNSVRAQYNGYRQEPGIRADSTTPTFGALRLEIENWRWQGVPFYLRSGKCLKDKVSRILIEFKRPPHLPFPHTQGPLSPNVLILYLQPDEGLHWRFEAKVPDTVADMRSVEMEFHYAEAFGQTPIPEAYERLLLDAMSGDAALFTRADEVEMAWGLIDPIAQAWEADQAPPVALYDAGTWGPAEADALLAADGRTWLDEIPHAPHVGGA